MTEYDIDVIIRQGFYEKDVRYCIVWEDSGGAVHILEPPPNKGAKWLGSYSISDRSQLPTALKNHFDRLSRIR